MFEQQHLTLRQRQLALRLRSAELRAALAAELGMALPLLGWADRARAAWTGWQRAASIGRVLAALAGVAIALGIVKQRERPRLRRLVTLARRALTLWSLWQAWRARPDAAPPPPPEA